MSERARPGNSRSGDRDKKPGVRSSAPRSSSRDGKPGDRKPRDGKPRSDRTRSGKPGEYTSRDGKSGEGKPRERRPRDAKPRDDSRPRGPHIPDEITGEELDKKVSFELKTLPEELATFVARCLVATSMTLDEDPELSLQYAQLAKKKAGRVAVVREAVGMAEYMNGHYQEALNEFRAAKRMTGSPEYLPLMADCERGLGRPERALDLAKTPEAQQLDADGKAELLLVTAGARQDLGQHDAALVLLAGPAGKKDAPIRVRYAYADALEGAGRVDEAAALFAQIAQDDEERITDADLRIGLVDDVEFLEEPADD